MKEKLSALVDGELDQLDERRVLDALADDIELRRTWERYHMVKAAVTRQLGMLAPPDLPERILARLDGDVAESAPGLRLWPMAGGLAAAASVAAIALLGWQALSGPNQPLAVPPTAVAQTPTENPPTVTPTSPAPGSEDRLSRYLVGHNEYMPTAGMGSMLPYVRVVAHGPDK